MAEVAQRDAGRRPWGYVATFAWVILALLFSQAIGIAALLMLRPDAILTSIDLLLKDVDLLLKDGVALSLSNVPANLAQIIVLALAARRPGWSITEYLGLIRPNARLAAITIAILVAFLLAFDATTYLLGRDIVTPFQVETYRSARAAGMLPLFWFALVIAAPVAEEIIFRGFLFRGWVTSARSAIPGILGISAFFAVIHIQYDWFGILQVFLIGLLLGVVRWHSGSTLLTILMHVLINFWATVQSMIKVATLS